MQALALFGLPQKIKMKKLSSEGSISMDGEDGDDGEG